MLYVFTYIWNLKKKNKENKTGQSHRHREQADSCQRAWEVRAMGGKKEKERITTKIKSILKQVRGS